MDAKKWIITGVTIAVAAGLLFGNLGRYALWDDEAVTALAAKGVWRTGDTSVVLDHNVVAYRSGLLLKGTHERSTPPLGAYLAAPMVGIFGGSTWALRTPFALIGLGSVCLMLFWLYTAKADWLTWLLVGMAIIGNVSLFLYSRQCRYYSPVIFSSILIAYLYANYEGKTWQLVLMAVAGLILLAGNYLNYMALHLCLLLDYTIIGRKRRWLKWQEWLIVLGPQVVVGAMIVLTWNTLGTGNKEYLTGNSIGQRVWLAWLNLRDIDACEYGVGPLILAAAGLYFIRRAQSWLWRAPVALIVYVVIVSMLSPQLLKGNPNPDADVRYLAPTIPLCIAIGVMALLEARRLHVAVPIVLATVCFGSNLVHGSWMRADTPVRSTLWAFVGELTNPPPEPYTPTIEWINKNVTAGQSVWVLPGFSTYPLMYHAPHPVYAWQFQGKFPEEFTNLPLIHLEGAVMPDYVVIFGPTIAEFMQKFQPQGVQRDVVAMIPVYFRDTYRPELFWHSFKGQPLTEAQVQQGLGVYVVKLSQNLMPGLIR